MDEKELHLGVVKWFGNHANGLPYGFIQVHIIGDVFVHIKNILETEIHEGECVICNLKKSINRNEKIEAFNVIKLINFTSVPVLFDFLSKYSQILETFAPIYSRIKTIISNFVTQDIVTDDFKLVNKYINDKFDLEANLSLNVALINNIITLTKQVINENDLRNAFVYEKLDEKIQFALFCYKMVQELNSEVISKYYFYSDSDLKSLVAKNLDKNFLSIILNEEIRMLTEKGEIQKDDELIKRILLLENLTAEKTRIIRKVYSAAKPEFKVHIWQLGQHSGYDHSIKEYLIKCLNNNNFSPILFALDIFTERQRKLFLSDLAEAIPQSKRIDMFSFYKLFLSETQNIKAIAYFDFKQLLENSLPDLEKTKLWLINNEIDISLRVIYRVFYSLGADEQENCIKKIFGTPNKYKIEESIALVKKLLERSNLIKGIGVHLAMYLILKQKSKEKFFYNDGYSIVLNKFTTNHSLSKYDSLFERCTGRTDKKGNVINPKNKKFCEGRLCKPKNKVKKENNDDIEKENNEETPFYWCKNDKCYRNAIVDQKNYEWQNIKLFTILKRIDQSLSEDDYSYKLGIINKIYIYIEHLKCRTCNSWLVPEKQSNYAKDRINSFYCNNPYCRKFREPIYISHCLNSKCEDIIDSRDSAKCSNGWYICKSCFGCCSTEKINTRKYIITKIGKIYSGPNQGHLDLGDIFCPKCGSLFIIENISNSKESITKANLWLESVKNNKLRCVKNGKDKFGHSWYLIRKINTEKESTYNGIINKLKRLGFTVNKADINDKWFFITSNSAQPVRFLQCSNSKCAEIVDLEEIKNKNRNRYRALSYHKQLKDQILK